MELVLVLQKSYLEGKIKVDGKTGNLGAGGVEVLEGDEDVTVNAEKISKRYLKYLTRRFLQHLFVFVFILEAFVRSGQVRSTTAC